MDELKQLISEFKNQRTVNEWKHLCKINMNAFVRRNSRTFFTLKATNYYFYVDTSTLTDSIILQGVKPNIGTLNSMKGFGVRTRQKVNLSKPIHVKIDDFVGWKTITHRMRGYHDLRSPKLDTDYFGVSGEPVEYFGAKKRKGKGKAQVFGVIEHEAVPIYSEQGLVEWLMYNKAEMFRILTECAQTAIQNQKRRY